MPKIAFADPLPIGLESRCEGFDLTVSATTTPEAVAAGLNAHLPAGLRVLGCEPVSGKKRGGPEEAVDRYRVTPPPGRPFDRGAIAAFLDRESWIVTRTNRKGKLKKIDLKDMIRDIDLDEAGRLMLSLGNAPGKTVRPAEVLREIFSLPEEEVQQSRMVKMEHHVQAARH
jgi:radical SAM-linked protein